MREWERDFSGFELKRHPPEKKKTKNYENPSKSIRKSITMLKMELSHLMAPKADGKFIIMEFVGHAAVHITNSTVADKNVCVFFLFAENLDINANCWKPTSLSAPIKESVCVMFETLHMSVFRHICDWLFY